MRSMTDVCSVFENWSRPERGLENRFHPWRRVKFPHTEAVASVIRLKLDLVMNGASFMLRLEISEV